MKNLNFQEMAAVQGGGNISNKSCMMLGGIAIGSAVMQLWPLAIGIVATAVVQGCLETW